MQLECINCPANYGSSSAASSCLLCTSIPDATLYYGTCQCNKGYTGLIPNPGDSNFISTALGTCTACPSGKYKSYIGYSNCESCGYGTSPVASVSDFDCICNAGIYGCPIGGVCLNSCPANTWVNAAPKGSAKCTCNTGYGTTVYNFNTYCQEDPTYPTCVSAPTTCPTGQYLPSSSSQSCSSSCVVCADGKYKVTTGTEACTNCPSEYGFGSMSPAGSTSFSACVCTHGAAGSGLFFIMDTTTSKCVRKSKCNAGKYGTADDCV